MTSDKLKTAIINYLSGELSLPVVDGESFTEIELPLVAVKITASQKFGLALSPVEQITVEVVYRAHSGDDDRDAALQFAETVSAALSNPSTLKTAINAVMEDGVIVDYLQFSNGAPSWDESTLECIFEGECYAQRA